MKKHTDNTDKNMELRSEKVRAILGTMPKALMRWSIVVITVILTALTAVITAAPYPYGGSETILQHILNN